ncbi:CLUMA_CG007918, isoform A [Clunio marinus]|uniref:CLUMA_CG007918, isoform A n=1 Tax=Clunio marinus TaxID=568069 RepID=A0A1J1I2H3_9DIPT|nr:CLUMA_CG007918, isoform A [Clunio marinus]
MILRLLLIITVTFALFNNAMPSKILFTVAFAGNSHWLMFQPLINELLSRGHEVTVITHFELKTDSKNYRQVLIRPKWDWDAIFNMTIPFEVGGTYESPFFKVKSLWDYGIATTKHALDSPVVKNFIENDVTKFDLVISEQFQQEAFNMFAHKYNCPLIVIGTLDYADFMDHAKGALTSWSHVPHALSYFSDRMTFVQRVENTILSLYDAIGHKNVKLFIGHGGIFGTQEAIYHAVPLIIFPFFGDQHLNGFKIQEAGMGLLDSMSTITTDSLTRIINKVLNNESFAQNIKKASEIFRTNQNEPLDTAIWWIEYVIKFKGAAHLQSPAKNLPWYRYLQLDIVFIVFGAIYIIYDLITMIKWLLLITIAASSISASNILVLSPMSIVSHWLYLEEIIKDLLIRGHKVTAVTSYLAKKKHENYTTINIPSLNLELQHFGSKNVYAGIYSGESSYFSFYQKMGLLVTENLLKNPKVGELILSKDQQFDLVIVEQIYVEAFYLFAHKFNCSLLTIALQGHSTVIDRTMGLFTPLSHVPHHALTHVDSKMTFGQRAYNAYISTYESFIRRFSYIPKQNKIAKKYFSEGVEGELPHVATMEKKIALTLVNSHSSIENPRPTMPSQVNIGGAHIRRILALPADVNEFLKTAENGFIFFSFGTFLKTDAIPNEIYTEIIEAFKALPYKVLMKLSVDPPADLPPNIMARRWFPQSDLFGHPKMLLFISHGGWLGVQEALHRGVPMLFIPFLNDQHRNAARAVKEGYGSVLQFDDITNESLVKEILKVTAPEYKAKALEMSKIFKDSLNQPMQEVTFWIEYVIRNNGAQHLKSTSVDLCWSKYSMIDVGFFYFSMFALSFLCSFMIIKFSITKYRGREQRGKFKYY